MPAAAGQEAGEFEDNDGEEAVEVDENAFAERLRTLRHERPAAAAVLEELSTVMGFKGSAKASVIVEPNGAEDTANLSGATQVTMTGAIRDQFVETFGKRVDARLKTRTELSLQALSLAGRTDEFVARENENDALRRRLCELSKEWMQSRFDGLADGKYPPGCRWPYTLGMSTIATAAKDLATFFDYLCEEKVVHNRSLFDFQQLESVEQLRPVFLDFENFFALVRQSMQQTTGSLQRLHANPSATIQEKALAARSIKPSSVKATLFGVTMAFKLPNVLTPRKSSQELISKSQLEEIGRVLQKQRGEVQAYNTRPLFIEDVHQAFANRPPRTMRELANYVVVLFQVKFGLRSSSLFPSKDDKTQKGLRLSNVTRISYDASLDEHIVVVTKNQDKAWHNLFDSDDLVIRSEKERCDLARLLFLFLGLHNVFALPLDKAMENNVFRFRPSAKELFLFGTPASDKHDQFMSDGPLTSDGMAKAIYRFIAEALKVPTYYLSSRSSRQGFAIAKVLDYLTVRPYASWREVKNKASDFTWKGDSTERYLKSTDNQMLKCYDRVQEIRRRDPNTPVDAREHFVFLHQYSLIQGAVRDFTEEEELAMREYAELAYTTAKEKDTNALVREGKVEEAKAKEAQINEYADVNRICNWRSLLAKTEKRARNVRRARIIQDALDKIHTIPKANPLPTDMLDFKGTYLLCRPLTNCLLEVHRQRVAFHDPDLFPGSTVLCPIADCEDRFLTTDAELMVRHMKEVHLKRGSNAQCRECRHFCQRKLTSWLIWSDHFAACHRHKICFECEEKLEDEDEEEGHSFLHLMHSTHEWCAIKLLYSDFILKCGCKSSDCVFSKHSWIRAQLDMTGLEVVVKRTTRRLFPWTAVTPEEKCNAFVSLGIEYATASMGDSCPPSYSIEHCLRKQFELHFSN